MAEQEFIGDNHELYRFMHETYKRISDPNFISKSSFKIDNRRVSVDWDQKTSPPCNPHETRAKNGNPSKYGVIFLVPKEIREKDFNAEYQPTNGNPAHSNIVIPEEMSLSDENKIKTTLRSLSYWKIRYDDPVQQN